MNDDQSDDLKQFIDARVSQSELLLRQEMHAMSDDLHQEIHSGFGGVGEAIEAINDRLDKRGEEVDTRLTKLEQQAA